MNTSACVVVIRREFTDKGVHLWMDKREHDTDGVRCWCGPAIYRICDDCDNGCWKCEGGTSEITADEAEQQDEPLLIVHRYA